MKAESPQNLILKTTIVFDNIIKLENKEGLLIIEEHLIPQTLDDGKRYLLKINKKEIKNIINVMLTSGLLITPKKGYLKRA